TIPEVADHDTFWAMKQQNKQEMSPESQKPLYKDIHLPKNSPMGIFIGCFSLFFGFALIWHIMWLVWISLFGVIVCTIIRLSSDDTDYYVPAAVVEKIESETLRRKH